LMGAADDECLKRAQKFRMNRPSLLRAWFLLLIVSTTAPTSTSQRTRRHSDPALAHREEAPGTEFWDGHPYEEHYTNSLNEYLNPGGSHRVGNATNVTLASNSTNFTVASAGGTGEEGTCDSSAGLCNCDQSINGYTYWGGTVTYPQGVRSTLTPDSSTDVPCLNLIFGGWTLDRVGKVVAAMLGLFLTAICVEAASWVRTQSQLDAMSATKGGAYLLSKSRTGSVTASTVTGTGEGDRPRGRGRCCKCCSCCCCSRPGRKLALVGAYLIQACSGLVLTMAAATYSFELFLSVIVGLSVGYAVFFDDDPDAVMGGGGNNIDASSRRSSASVRRGSVTNASRSKSISSAWRGTYDAVTPHVTSIPSCAYMADEALEQQKRPVKKRNRGRGRVQSTVGNRNWRRHMGIFSDAEESENEDDGDNVTYHERNKVVVMEEEVEDEASSEDEADSDETIPPDQLEAIEQVYRKARRRKEEEKEEEGRIPQDRMDNIGRMDSAYRQARAEIDQW